MPAENIGQEILKPAVDFLSRYMSAKNEEVFASALCGASLVGETDKAVKFLNAIKSRQEMDEEGVYCAIKLAAYYAIGKYGPNKAKSVDSISPDEKTIFSVKINGGEMP